VLVLVLITAVELLGGRVISREFFHGEQGLVWALEFGLVGFFAMHLTRGVLSGNGRFGPYGVMMAAEGVVRLAAAVALAVAGVQLAGLYGACIGAAAFAAVAIALGLARPRSLLTDGPAAPYSELSTALGWLLLGSVAMQLLGYTPLLGVNLLEHGGDKAAAAAFASAFFIARIPVLLFQAVQGTLLPKLAALAGAGRAKDFRDGLVRLLVVVVGIAVLGTVAALVAGPFAGRILFKDFSMSASNLALLAAGSGAFIVALTIAQALIAVNAYARVAFSWLAGVAVFVVVCSLIGDLFVRVELGFLAGATASGALMLVQLGRAMRRGLTPTAEALLEAFEHEPLEL
jgi:O-antigen/teichoic acid export membrane protein